MPDLFTPLHWNDGEEGGTPITAARGPQRWENGIEALDNAVDELGDRVDALIASGIGILSSGPSSARPAPALGQVYLDTDLGYPIYGLGSGWIKADGTAVSGAGGGNAPLNFQCVVQPDNSIVCNWDWPGAFDSGGGDTGKLYETASPTGVSGATALTANTTTRTPSTLRTYDYWLTATIDGVESAQSDHAIVSLPFGSTPGGGGGTGGGDTPAEILNINGVGTGQGGWWDLGIGFHAGDPEGPAHKNITPTILAGGYIRADYFVPSVSNTAVDMKVYMDGGKTSDKTKYPRCELREYKNATTKAAWNGSSGTHIIECYRTMLHFAPNKQECCLVQVHDASDDTMQIRQEGTNLVLKVNGDSIDVTIKTGHPVGTEFLVKSELINGTLKTYLDGSLKHTTSPGWGAGQYYKVGTYAQANVANGNSPSEYHSSRLRGLVVTHSPSL